MWPFSGTIFGWPSVRRRIVEFLFGVEPYFSISNALYNPSHKLVYPPSLRLSNAKLALFFPSSSIEVSPKTISALSLKATSAILS